jgi:hypothetical protein
LFDVLAEAGNADQVERWRKGGAHAACLAVRRQELMQAIGNAHAAMHPEPITDDDVTRGKGLIDQHA